MQYRENRQCFVFVSDSKVTMRWCDLPACGRDFRIPRVDHQTQVFGDDRRLRAVLQFHVRRQSHVHLFAVVGDLVEQGRIVQRTVPSGFKLKENPENQELKNNSNMAGCFSSHARGDKLLSIAFDLSFGTTARHINRIRLPRCPHRSRNFSILGDLWGRTYWWPNCAGRQGNIKSSRHFLLAFFETQIAKNTCAALSAYNSIRNKTSNKTRETKLRHKTGKSSPPVIHWELEKSAGKQREAEHIGVLAVPFGGRTNSTDDQLGAVLPFHIVPFFMAYGDFHTALDSLMKEENAVRWKTWIRFCWQNLMVPTFIPHLNITGDLVYPILRAKTQVSDSLFRFYESVSKQTLYIIKGRMRAICNLVRGRQLREHIPRCWRVRKSQTMRADRISLSRDWSWNSGD